MPRLWVKLHTSAELKSIRIAVPTVLGELRCGHITSVYFGMGWRELFWDKCPTVVPCATADEESGSSLKLVPVWINPSCYSVQENWFWKCVLSNEPLHKI